MRTFQFEGASDDTFGEYNQTNEDYDNCASGKPIQFKLSTPDGEGVLVTGIYCLEGVWKNCSGWSIAVATLDEDKPLNGWTFELKPDHEGYRNQLTVVAPDSAELELLTGKGKERDS